MLLVQSYIRHRTARTQQKRVNPAAAIQPPIPPELQQRCPIVLDRKVSRLSALLAATNAINSSLDIDQVLNTLVRIVKEQLQAETVSLSILDNDGNLRVGASLGLIDESLPKNSVLTRIGTGITGQVAAEKRVIVVADTTEDLRVARPEYNRRHGLISYLGAPIVLKEKVLGVLSIMGQAPHEYSEDEQALLQALANQAAVAIENASLYREVELRAQALSREVITERDNLQALIAHSADGVFSVDAALRITAFNPAMEQLTGLQASAVIGTSCCDPASPIHETILKISKPFLDLSGDPHHRTGYVETTLRRTDDSDVDISASYAIIRDETGRMINGVAILRDITSRREIEKIRANLVSIASHELRTPLAVIQSIAELVYTDAEKMNSEQVQEFTGIMLRQCRDLRRLIDDTLDLARMESGRLRLNLSEININDLISQNIERIKLWLDTQQPGQQHPAYEIAYDAQESLPSFRGDAGRLDQVLNNLLTNAVKYSPYGGQIRLSVTRVSISDGLVRLITSGRQIPALNPKSISRLEDGDWLIVSIRDHGIGIAATDRPYIFEPYHRAEQTGQRIKGTGLGLALSKHIVEAHGGKIWVESEPDRGSTFSFALPMEIAGD